MKIKVHYDGNYAHDVARGVSLSGERLDPEQSITASLVSQAPVADPSFRVEFFERVSASAPDSSVKITYDTATNEIDEARRRGRGDDMLPLQQKRHRESRRFQPGQEGPLEPRGLLSGGVGTAAYLSHSPERPVEDSPAGEVGRDLAFVVSEIDIVLRDIDWRT